MIQLMPFMVRNDGPVLRLEPYSSVVLVDDIVELDVDEELESRSLKLVRGSSICRQHGRYSQCVSHVFVVETEPSFSVWFRREPYVIRESDRLSPFLLPLSYLPTRYALHLLLNII
jgi:hypothetical protein